MDPFDNLPAEVRIKILGSIHSYATTARLIRASPIMLAQYTTTESSNLREYLSQLIGTDVNDHELLQDALAIVELGENYHQDDICDILREWKAKALPLPFGRGGDGTITKLRLLFERMSEFIDDYLSKATAQNTAEAYLQGPRRTYIDTVDPQRITLLGLNPQERLRFFQVFIKFEVLCKLNSPRVHKARDTIRMKVPKLSSWEKEASMCVYEYMRASYSAMFAQCVGAQRFKDYKKFCDLQRQSNRETAFFVETMCYDPRYPFLCCKIPKYAADFPMSLPWCGFDVLLHLMMEAKTEHKPMWIAKMCSRYDRRSYDSVQYIVETQLDRPPPNRRSRDFSPSEAEAHQIQKEQRTIRRQRARAFFDDARLCPGKEAHFPTEEEIETEVARLKIERRMKAKKEWEEYFAKKRSSPPWYKDPQTKVDPNSYIKNRETQEDTEICDRFLTPPPFFALPEARRLG
ncbi:hypothetical protein FVEG_12204 [Fusarium verticillioides 7600]|uniref:Uncharacterized protein n=1 Tax=Gibberella moniliformis (strain M3125 / FGSC 7600) TaxID=334819 RepID=W7MR05_GIBM7|nr:hypothetical protein FVEG_12204 [Fusarium verticillioides 7600]EWG53868.1 hypothetical protein FVEG_12204 [Fusarium verticillioides 7600]